MRLELGSFPAWMLGPRLWRRGLRPQIHSFTASMLYISSPKTEREPKTSPHSSKGTWCTPIESNTARAYNLHDQNKSFNINISSDSSTASMSCTSSQTMRRERRTNPKSNYDPNTEAIRIVYRTLCQQNHESSNVKCLVMGTTNDNVLVWRDYLLYIIRYLSPILRESNKIGIQDSAKGTIEAAWCPPTTSKMQSPSSGPRSFLTRMLPMIPSRL